MQSRLIPGLVLLVACLSRIADAIGCYKCATTNNDTTCLDPFNPGTTNVSLYDPDCKSGIDGRIGHFPARYCLKVSGYIAGTNEQIVIRTCTVSKLLDSDSSHSSFTLRTINGTDIQVVSGLIASCKDDGCNKSTALYSTSSSLHLLLSFLVLSHFLLVNFNFV